MSYLLITRKTPGFSAPTHRAKNLYNIASFYIRNAYSASIKSNADHFPHEKQVLEELNGVVDELNVIRQKHHSTPIHIIDHEHRFVSMQHLDGFFKVRDQIDHSALPAQANQNVLHMLYRDWKSFFVALADYKAHPDKYEAIPHIPRYADKDGYKPLIFTNQIC